MSGRKNVILPYHLVKGETVDADFMSDAINIQYLDNMGLQFKAVGDLEGSVDVLASINGVDFEALDFGAAMLVSGDTSFLVNMQQLPYTQIKIKINASSGESVVDVWTTVKEL